MSKAVSVRRTFGALVLALYACTGQTDKSANPVLPSLTKRYSCTSNRVKIVSSSDDSLSTEERCALVQAAFRRIADQASGELPRSDTSAITSAQVASFAFADTAGRGVEAYWTVNFALSDRPYDAVVRVDRNTGTLTATQTHKPF